jgi:hypothetical protein
VSKEAQRTIFVKHHRWAAWLAHCIREHMSQTGLEANIRVVTYEKEYKLGPISKLKLLPMVMTGADVGDALRFSPRGLMPRKL